jgi:hypothetical protein
VHGEVVVARDLEHAAVHRRNGDERRFGQADREQDRPGNGAVGLDAHERQARRRIA